MSCVNKNTGGGSQSYDRSIQNPKRTSSDISAQSVSTIEQQSLLASESSGDSFSSGVWSGEKRSDSQNVLSMLYQMLNLLQSLLGFSSSQDRTASALAETTSANRTTTPVQPVTTARDVGRSERSKRSQKTDSLNAPVSPKNTAKTPSTSNSTAVPGKTGIEAMDRWDGQIQAAAESTGLPANYIKATIWAESRGNPSTATKNPYMDAIDEGVMQISDETYKDVMDSQPNAPRGLKASNPADSIMMGAWELKDKSEKAGGDLHATSGAYRGHGNNRDSIYASNIMTHMKELDEGKPLSEDPNGNPDG